MSWISNTVSGWLGLNRLLVDYNTFDIKEISPEAMFAKYDAFSEKVKVVLQNPALLKVISLQCDLFSLGEVYVYQNGKAVDKDPILKTIYNPNPRQTKSQVLWDYMFWNMMGMAVCYVDSDIADKDGNKLYFLDLSKIEWPDELLKKGDKFIFSKGADAEILKTTITYRYGDGSAIQFPLSKLIIITDLTNGLGNWFSGNSRIDALYKIIANSEESLDAKNINTRYTGKFIVAGQQDPSKVDQLPMGEEEKQDIETKINGRKKVHATKSMIDIKRFVSDMNALGLDEAYLADYFLIGSMYNIPRDILEASLEGSTYENQEKATMRHVSYTLQPKGNEFFAALANRVGYTEAGKSIVIDWQHLPFAQVFEKDRAQTEQIKINSFVSLLNAGVSLPEVNKYLDLDFKTGERQQTTFGQAGTGQGQNSQQAN